MFLPVERSITVSEPHLIDQRIFSTSSSIEDSTAELPMFALIFTRKLRPMIIGSDSGWLMFVGIMARPAATSLLTNSGVISDGILCGNRWKTEGGGGFTICDLRFTIWELPACCLFSSLRTMSWEKSSM